MAIVGSNILPLLKTVYLSGVTNNKYQNSPILHKIKKESWGSGKEIRYAAQYGNGGNFGSDYSLLSSNKTSGVENMEWVATQGYMTGLFEIDQPEILSTAEERGAYMKALANKMAGCFDGMSKTLAMYLYGGKYGVIDQVAPASGTSINLIAGNNTMPITSAGSLKLDVGSRFVFASAGAADSALPSSPLLNAVCTVTAIDDTSVTFTSSSAVTIYRGDYIELYGSRVGGTQATGIEGLAEIIPSYFDRTGATWNTYIATPFRDKARNVAVNRLAGQFQKAAGTGNTRLTDALVSLLKKTKRAGGLNNIVIINDETWDKVGEELGIQRNLWQATNTGDNKNKFTGGYSDLATAFGDAFIGRTVIDPYCTEGLAYMLDTDDLTFYDLGNVSKVVDNVSNDQLGKPTIEGTGDQGIGDQPNVKINMDKLFTITEGAKGHYGPAVEIAAHVYGNYILRKTASAGVAVLK